MRVLQAIVPALGLPLLVGCGWDLFGSSSNASDPPAAPADAPDADVDAGVVNAPPVEQPPPGCDVSALPAQNPCVIDESLGVFVSKTLGKDETGDGSRKAPYATLGKAITSAAAAKKRVYACAESYAEAVTLADGVSMFGSFDCVKGWVVDAAKHAAIAAPTSPAVHAKALASAVRVDGFDVTAPAGSGASQSSIGIVAANAADLTIANAHVLAKDGTAGADGQDGVQLSNGPDVVGTDNVNAEVCTGLVGVCRQLHSGGAGGVNACVGASGIAGGPGGRGGYGGYFQCAPPTPPPPPPRCSVVESATDGEAATASTAQGGTQVTNAASGAKGANGANGASSQGGTFTENGFTAGDGTAGQNGASGQGGGGGAGGVGITSSMVGNVFGGSGAGGGAGGCPGLAGTAGKGGGASVGVVSIDSKLRFENATIESSNGGNGGKGTLGSLPTSGAAPGKNNTSVQVAAGGSGGAGGEAGVSGHGAGGPSVAIAFKGTKPDVTGATLKHGTAGKGQSAISNNNATHPRSLAASPAGAADTVYAIP